MTLLIPSHYQHSIFLLTSLLNYFILRNTLTFIFSQIKHALDVCMHALQMGAVYYWSAAC